MMLSSIERRAWGSCEQVVLTLPHKVNTLLYAAPELRLERLKALGFQLIEPA